MYSFEKLDVWQKARSFVNEIYKTTKKYPEKEKFVLGAHTCKSAISILSNIAEGTSRTGSSDAKRFIEIALGSVYETVAQLYIAVDNGYITQKEFEKLYESSGHVSRMLSGLSRFHKTPKP